MLQRLGLGRGLALMEVVEELGVLGILLMERNEGSMFGCRYGGDSRRGEVEADGPIVRFGGAMFRVFSGRGFCSFLCIPFLKEGRGRCESIAMGVLLGSLSPSKSGSRGVLSGIKRRVVSLRSWALDVGL